MAEPSVTQTGMIGYNTIPSARMNKAGTMRVGSGYSDPYWHGFLGFQITESAYINIRQTAEVSSMNDHVDATYPGLDMKFTLMDEARFRPAIAVGFDSAFGNKKFASEYLSFSKRFHDIDLTAGIGWGRLGSKGHIKNPLKGLSSHFGKERQFNDINAQNLDNWFTGDTVGFFGGIDYQTPLSGLSLSVDYNGDDYAGTSHIHDFDPPSPWSIGMNYKPYPWIDLSAGMIGTEKVMVRASLQQNASHWTGRYTDNTTYPTIREEGHHIATTLHDNISSPHIIGRAVQLTANSEENKTIHLSHKGLKGPNITLLQSDIKKLHDRTLKSTDEIWQNAIISPHNSNNIKPPKRSDIDLEWNTKLSLSEDENGVLYRTSIIADYERPLFKGFHIAAAARFNIMDNLDYLTYIQTLKNTVYGDTKNTRLNEEQFADRNISIDTLNLSWRGLLADNLYTSITAGYLEEMYAGYGAEILYRPYKKRYAIGAEAWHAIKRNPFSDLNHKLENENDSVTGHITFYYEMLRHNTTAYGKIGRYLGEDFGATAGIENNFKNGVKLNAFITATDEQDYDLLGGDTNLYGGMKLTLPIGNTKFIPDGSHMTLDISALGRNYGQTIQKPLDLYQSTEPFAYRQIHQNWSDLLD